MAELALIGKFLLLPKVLLYRRIGHGSFIGHLKPANLANFIDPQKSYNVRMPLLSWHLGIFRSGFARLICLPEKMKTLMILLRHAAGIVTNYGPNYGLWL